MVNIDASTPQLKAVKNWIDAMTSLDSSKVAPLISRNFKYRPFPQAVELPDQAKDVHIQWIGVLMASISKMGVTIHEVIEAPGKVVAQLTFVTIIDGTTYDYDSLAIISLVEEDGDVKILEYKGFSDPHKRGAFHAAIAKATQGKPAS